MAYSACLVPPGSKNMANDHEGSPGTWETLPSPSKCRPETRLTNSRWIHGPVSWVVGDERGTQRWYRQAKETKCGERDVRESQRLRVPSSRGNHPEGPRGGKEVSGDTKTDPPGDTKTDPLLDTCQGGNMDNVDPDLVYLLDTQADRSDVTNVHLRSTQEDTRMLEPDVVDRIHQLSGQGLGSKRIARQLGISRNSVRRYLAGATVGFQERLAARRLDGPTLSEVHQLFGTVAEGNTVVIQQELASRGIHIDLRTLQRAVATLRQEERARALATVRFETRPGQQIQIDFGEKVVQIAGQPVKVYLMTAVLGHSRRLYCRAFLAQRQDDWLEGLEGAFQHFGGLTEQVLCDNASPLVTSHDRQSGQVVWNPGFETFCRDRGLTAKACRPRRARTKGKIERGVGYVKHNALAGRLFASFEVLQRHLALL